MLNAKTKTTRNLFVLLFFALACDLGSRYANQGFIMTAADMASTADPDKACLETGRCEIKRGGEKTLIELRQTKRRIEPGSFLGQPVQQQTPVVVPELAKVEIANIDPKLQETADKKCPAAPKTAKAAKPTPCQAAVAAAKKKIADIVDRQNEANKKAILQSKDRRDEALKQKAQQTAATEEDIIEVTFDTTLEGTACVDGSCSIPGNAAIPAKLIAGLSPIEARIKLAPELKKARLEHEKLVAQEKESRAKLKKIQEEEARALAKLEKDKAACRVGPNGEKGKEWGNAEQMDCKVDRLFDLDSPKAVAAAYESGLRADLRAALESSNPEERSRALEVAKQISQAGRDLPPGVTQSARAMLVAGNYNHEFLRLNEQLSRTPINSHQHAVILSRLNHLRNDAATNLNRAHRFTSTEAGKEEYLHWGSILDNNYLSISGAASGLPGVGATAQRTPMDLNVAQRTARDTVPGGSLLTNQAAFNALTLTGLQQDINNIGRAGQGQMPGQLPHPQQRPTSTPGNHQTQAPLTQTGGTRPTASARR